MDISVYKKPYNNSCQMSFIPSQNTSKSMSVGASPQTLVQQLTALLRADKSYCRTVLLACGVICNYGDQ